MDVSMLHTMTENLAEWLSEVTQGDLRQPTPVPAWDVGDLYLHLIDRNIVIAAHRPPTPSAQRHDPQGANTHDRVASSLSDAERRSHRSAYLATQTVLA